MQECPDDTIRTNNSDESHSEKRSDSPAPHQPAKHRANVLLDRILSDDASCISDIAEALVTNPEVIRKYQNGQSMPIERQMLLAAYAIERAPKYARMAHGLRGQIRATIAFAAGETETHSGPPPTPQHRW
jgi:hypothetical protein